MPPQVICCMACLESWDRVFTHGDIDIYLEWMATLICNFYIKRLVVYYFLAFLYFKALWKTGSILEKGDKNISIELPPVLVYPFSFTHTLCFQRTTRGMLCDVYSMVRYDLFNFKGKPAIFEYYFMAVSILRVYFIFYSKPVSCYFYFHRFLAQRF